MTEPAPRPAPTRGRGNGRGGRGGSRGSTRPRDRQTNGDHKEPAMFNDFADEGEIGEKKKKYAQQIAQIKEVFPVESDDDLAFALDEVSGDISTVIDQITDGRFSRFSDVKTTKERTKPKPKEPSSTAAGATNTASKPVRARGGHDTVRGGSRGRPERGRGGIRASRGGHAAANGVRAAGDTKSVPTSDASWNVSGPAAENSGGWDTSANTDSIGGGVTSSTTPAVSTGAAKPALVPDGAPKQSWAQLLRKPEPSPPVPKPVQAATLEPSPPSTEEPPAAAAAEQEAITIPPTADEVPTSEALEAPVVSNEPSIQLTPSKDLLTQENVEHLPDSSLPNPSETVVSTRDSHSGTPSVTQHASTARLPLAGYPTAMHRAIPTPRSASFQRRYIHEQQEAVVMPSHRAIDTATVQFGSMGLNGDAELDVDEDREDAETRQPPQQSPPSQPRASLPPAPRQPAVPTEPQLPESIQATKPAPGLPPVQQHQPAQTPSTQIAPQTTAQQGSQPAQPYSQFGRIGQNFPTETATASKSYDLFGQHQSQQSAFDNYPTQSQAPGQQQQQSHLGGFSSGTNDYPAYYTSEQARTYPNFYSAGYSQQNAGNQQETGTSQQRTGSAFSGSAADLGYSNQANVREKSILFNEPAVSKPPSKKGEAIRAWARVRPHLPLPIKFGSFDHYYDKFGNLRPWPPDTPPRPPAALTQHHSRHSSSNIPDLDSLEGPIQHTWSVANPTNPVELLTLEDFIDPEVLNQPDALELESFGPIDPVTDLDGNILTETELLQNGPSEDPAPQSASEGRFVYGSLTIRLVIGEIEIYESVTYESNQQTSSQARYGASTNDNAQNSGHTTPNPPLGSGVAGGATVAPTSQFQQTASQAQQQQQQSQQQPFNQQTPQGHTGAQHPGYGSYNNYYNNPYYASYMNQYPYSQGAGAYGGGPFGRNNYTGGGPGAHHGYGMPSHSSYDQQSSSPANVGAFGGSSLHDRTPGLGGGLGDYARSGSAQGGNQTGGGFGGMGGGDGFGRSPSGFPSQNTPYGQQSSNQQQQAGANNENDPLKPFGDSKGTGGPSPGLPGRPGSAANQNSGLPPPQSQHAGFGPYSSQFGQSAYGSLGGLGGQHGQHGQGYGGYGGGFSNYGGSYGRGGWGGTYGAH